MNKTNTDEKASSRQPVESTQDVASTIEDEEILAALLDHARDDLRLAEFKAGELRYWHTADDCVNARIAIEKLIMSRKG